MFDENYRWNYDYPRLAFDSGFAFEKTRGNSFDKNKISLIDIDRIIKDRDIATVEKFIPCLGEFVLDPEKAEILDDHFVKIFRLSQLTVQYLLFCKKYLDHALVDIKQEIKKTQQENKELNLFVEDLKQHIAVLMNDLKEQNTIATFKCQHCNKVFSTEDFLNSHIKRRHSNQENLALEVETDKLHMEIKELKGRLNTAEKLIQQDQNNQKSVIHETESSQKINEFKKIEELQQKFEDLRVQVQSELKVLQTQYNFQEKYEKLFEKMALQNSDQPQKIQNNEVRNFDRRRESTTQTETEIKPQKVEDVSEVKNKENIPDYTNTQRQLSEFGEALEVKVTTSLEKIENQMQSFWNKLHDMEIHRKIYSDQNSEETQVAPPVKPRSKYTVKKSPSNDSQPVKKIVSPPTVKKKTQIPKKVEKIQVTKGAKKIKETVEPVKALDQTPIKPNEKETSSENESSTESDSESETISISEVTDKEVIKKSHLKSSHLLPPKVKHDSPKIHSKKHEVSPELFEHFKEEVEKIMVMGRLQDLGVSPEWTGLPTDSFQKALEIINHRASLMKKTYPHFNKIAAKIEKEVTKKLDQEIIANKNQKNTLKEKSKKDQKGKLTVNKRDKVPPSQIEIKNRKMYETSDSDSEPVKLTEVKGRLKEFSAPYSAVIEELKSVTTKYQTDKSVSDVSSVKEDNLKNDETKGVLKNYPSVVSLTKKKVLFNLEDNADNIKIISNKEGGSTTTITSSVLDGSPKKPQTVKPVKEKDIEDLSDFDFSDM